MDDDGICFWCLKPAVATGIAGGLCDEHYVEEQLEMMVW
ncbi:hypothetical protein FHT44_005178 [Mycolicibacterium sp. BK634]|nr:hypothetical protein [Mycolicibacterium sp. BK634]